MKLKTILATLLVCSQGMAFAGTVGEVTAPPAPKFYVGLEGGASISLDTDFQPQFDGNNTYTFIAPNNSDWTRDLGTAGFGGLFLGYECNPNVAFQFTWDYRSGYNYNLHAAYGVNSNNPNSFLQDRFESGDIKVQTFLFDLILKPHVNWGGFVPYVKGGIGLAHNEMGTLRNVQLPSRGEPVTYDARVNGDSVTSFAWDAGVGANYFFNSNTSVGLGYRFVDAGKLRTKNTFHDVVNNMSGTVSPFETKHLFLSEFVASVAYHFGYA